MRTKLVFLILAFSFVFVSCDEIQNLDQSKDGEIVWVGNGLETPYRLTQNSGVIVDFKSDREGDKARSFFIDEDGRKDFIVKDKASKVEAAADQSEQSLSVGVPAKFEWARLSREFGRLLELKLNEKSSSAAYEILKNGKLALRASLQALWDRDDTIEPVFLETGEILFVNAGADLVLLNRKGSRKLGEQVLSLMPIYPEKDAVVEAIFPIARFETAEQKAFLLLNDLSIEPTPGLDGQTASVDLGQKGSAAKGETSLLKINYCIDNTDLCFDRPIPEGWKLLKTVFNPYRSELVVVFNSVESSEHSGSMLWIVPSTVFQSSSAISVNSSTDLNDEALQITKFIYPEIVQDVRMFDIQDLSPVAAPLSLDSEQTRPQN